MYTFYNRLHLFFGYFFFTVDGINSKKCQPTESKLYFGVLSTIISNNARSNLTCIAVQWLTTNKLIK